MSENSPLAKSKKAQEEIMGFIIIVVLIVIIGLFFIFMLKPKTQEAGQSMQVFNLLSGIKHLDSKCDKEIQEVVIMCRNDETCADESACSYLEHELAAIINTAIEKAGLGNIISYNLDIEGTSISIKSGNATVNSIAAISPISQDTSMKLRFFYP